MSVLSQDMPQAGISAVSAWRSVMASVVVFGVVPNAALAADEPGLHTLPSAFEAAATPQQLRWRNAGIITGASALVGAYGYSKWWNEGFNKGFHAVNEDWFGRDTQYGGQDKLGHTYFSYVGMRLLTRAFELGGNEPGNAIRLGAWSTLGIMTAVEMLDGYSRQHQFSKEDAIMNVIGALGGYVLESNPDLDRLFDFRLLYKPSPEVKQAGRYNIASDYTGQTYLLVAKANGVPALREHPVLRYLELAVGYGTNGYESTQGVPRTRRAYFGVSLNVTEVLRQTVFSGARQRSAVQRTSEMFFELIQVPGTAALANHQF